MMPPPRGDRPLPGDVVAVARLGVKPSAEPRAPVAAVRPAIADRCGEVCPDVGEIEGRADLRSLETETSRRRVPPETLAWCLVYPTWPE